MESSSELTPYELRVKRNIEENRRVLQSLGLLKQGTEQKNTSNKTVRSPVAVKRRSSFKPKEESPAYLSIPARRTRFSSVILNSQGDKEFNDDPIASCDEENTPPHTTRKDPPKNVFGPIEGVSVGDWWSTRIECSAAGIHRPTVAGIHGKTDEGCYSIALSGGYEDDIDYGECFTYTGSGGRDLKGTKTNPKNLRTAPQTKDQVLEGPNAALVLNVENHQPVRVIRGYKLPSPYAPEEGYRYDGLYSVERSWTATGLSGFKVYKFALKRLQDQDPPPWLTNGPQGEGDCVEHKNTHPNIFDKPTSHLMSSANHSPNSVGNIIGDEDASVTQNINSSLNPDLPSDFLNSGQNVSEEKDSKIMLKRNVRLSCSEHEPEGSVPESKCHTNSPNSSQNIFEEKDMTEKHSAVSLKINKRPCNSKPSLVGMEQESKYLEPLNSIQNISEENGETEKHTELATKRKRTSSNLELDPEKTQEPKSPADTLSSFQNVSEDNDKTEKNTQTTKRMRMSSDFKPQRAIQEFKSSLNSLNCTKKVSEEKDETEKHTQITTLKQKETLSNLNLGLKVTQQESKSPADCLNSGQDVSVKKDEIEKRPQITNIRKRTSSISDPEVTEQEFKSSTNSLNRTKHVSEEKDETEISLSNSMIDSERTHESESSADTMNSVQSVSEDNNDTEKNTQRTTKRRRTSSNSDPGEADQELKSSTNCLNCTQNVREEEGGTEKHTQMITKRVVRTLSNSMLDSQGTRQESEYPAVTLKSDQDVSVNNNETEKYIQRTTKRKRTSSNSVPGEVEQEFNPNNSLNCTQNAPKDKIKTEEHTQLTTKTIGTLSNSKVEGIVLEFKSSTNSLNSDACSPNNFCLQGQLTPLKTIKYSIFNSNRFNEICELESTEKLPDSNEKKVRFSPEVTFTDVEGKITSGLISEENKYSARKLKFPKMYDSVKPTENSHFEDREGNSPHNCEVGNKKQASILRYFGPVRKADKKHSARGISRGILLRSNRRSFDQTLIPAVHLVDIHDSLTPHQKNELIQYSPKKKSFISNRIVKSQYRERKRSSSGRTETEMLFASKKTNSAKKRKNTLSSAMSTVKPCYVLLTKLDTAQSTSPSKFAFWDEDTFLGWDWNTEEVVEFLGFDLGEEPHILFYGFNEEYRNLSHELLLLKCVIRKISDDE